MYRTILLLTLLAMTTLASCDAWSGNSHSGQNPDSAMAVSETDSLQLPAIEPTLNIFGIDERLEVTTHTVRRNESLSTILRKHGLSPHDIHELSRASYGVFDVRRVRAGQPLHIYFSPDSMQSESIAYVVYEENASDFIRFNLLDSISVERDSKPVEILTRLAGGIINSSLYQALRDMNVDPQLTNRLADVFAWQVDFYRIQPGDHFKVYFEERLIDGNIVEIGRIKAAVFTHRNQEYYAFHYMQNGRNEYFDEHGNSLRRQFMAAPLDYSRISSRFTNRRYHPVLKRNMPHHGTDYAAPMGTPVRAVGDGTITAARYDRNNGNYIRIRHNSVYETGYLHMSRFASGMQPGAQVEQGQIIGYVGQTGLATGPHLCFRFWQHGRPVDPRNIDLPPADPIQDAHRASFSTRKSALMTKLEVDPDTVLDRPSFFAIRIGYDGVLSNHRSYDSSGTGEM